MYEELCALNRRGVTFSFLFSIVDLQDEVSLPTYAIVIIVVVFLLVIVGLLILVAVILCVQRKKSRLVTSANTAALSPHTVSDTLQEKTQQQFNGTAD